MEQRELDQLIADNLRIPEAENNKDTAFLTSVIDDRLVFRKANGEIIDRANYLSGLPGPQRREASDNVRLLHVTDKTVVVEALVYTLDSSGEREKSYRNIRVFIRVKESASWRCCL